MKPFHLVLLALVHVPFAVAQTTVPTPPRPLPPSIENALQELSKPGPRRVHLNEPPHIPGDEGSDFIYRPSDLYDDCPDTLDALAKTREPIDDQLLRMADKGKELPERYRAVWVLIERRNVDVIPILEKMAASPSAEERYLAWTAYSRGVYHGRLAAPRSVSAALKLCQDEKNRRVRAVILGFFGSCKAKEAIPFLVASLEKYTDSAAIHALGDIRDPDTVPAIIASLKKVTLNRHIHFRVLGQIGTPEAVECLIGCLDEGTFAVEALFETRSPKALPAIEKYLAKLMAQKAPDELDVATAQISVLRLKHADPREKLLALAADQKQSEWMRTGSLQALGHYDKTPIAARLLKLYRTEKEDEMRMLCIRLLCDQPGSDITEALIDQALADDENKYYFSHTDLRLALNQRLNTSFRTMPPLVKHLRQEREGGK